MTTTTISPITTIDDLLLCAPLLASAYNNSPWNDNWGEHDAYRKLEIAYRCPDFIGFMALHNGALQGALVGNIEPYYTGDYFYLRDMFVPFGTQHRGFGRALLSHLIDHLEERSINQIILFTSREFFPFEFYASMGFAELPDMRMMLRASPTNA